MCSIQRRSHIRLRSWLAATRSNPLKSQSINKSTLTNEHAFVYCWGGGIRTPACKDSRTKFRDLDFHPAPICSQTWTRTKISRTRTCRPTIRRSGNNFKNNLVRGAPRLTGPEPVVLPLDDLGTLSGTGATLRLIYPALYKRAGPLACPPCLPVGRLWRSYSPRLNLFPTLP